MLQTTTITSKGQVTIPAYLRQQLGLKTGQRVKFTLVKANPNHLIVESIPDFITLQGTFKSDKKYSKQAARKAYLPDVLAGKI